MTKSISRKKAIRKGKRLQRRLRIVRFFQSLFRRQKNTRRDERFIETAYGKVRTLCYGFNNPEILPVYFDLHGGGFVLDSADVDEEINLEFLEKVGCKIISIDYAKAPKHPFPTAVNQIYSIVNHVYENAEAFGIDRKKMGIGGHSSGGNLSAAVSLKANKEGQFQLVCQILDFPVFDLAADPYSKPQPEGCIPPEMAVVFNACYVDPAQAEHPYASPLFAKPENIEGLPPALFILAGMDSLYDEGLQYCDMLEEGGVPTECYMYPDAPHGFTFHHTDDADDAIRRMITFLKTHLMSG
jgi:acetyl esterase